MRIVVLTRAPWWLSYRRDRFAQHLSAEGHTVAGIIVERLATPEALRRWIRLVGLPELFRKAASRLSKRGGTNDQRERQGSGSPPTTARGSSPVRRVKDHNSTECSDVVRQLEPDVIILRACRIIKPALLTIPRIGVLNGHYGKLPEYRGTDVTEWAVFHGDPVVVSVHWVLAGVDTGAVLAAREIGISPDDTLLSLREKSARASKELFLQVLRSLETDSATKPTPGGGVGRQYFLMHPRLRQLAAARLAQQSTSA